MFRWLALLISICLSTTFFGCEYGNNVDENASKEIKLILHGRFLAGYQSKDVDLYLSAFSQHDFRHESSDGNDNIIFRDIQHERQAAESVFARFKEIEMSISDIQIDFPYEYEAKVQCHYQVEFITEYGESTELYNGFYAEGDSIFTFKKSNGDEWRITEWEDRPMSEETIKAKYQ